MSQVTTDHTSNESFAIQSEKIIDDLTAFYFQVTVWLGMTSVVAVFGICSNLVNMIVFTRQLRASTETSHASLLCLAISDFCCVTTMFLVCITFGFVIKEPENLPWNAWDLMYIGAAWPHVMFAQITRTVTAYVALERCICVVFPFLVKRLITSRRTYIVVASLFIFGACSHLPVFIHQKLVLAKEMEQNRTVLLLVSHVNWQPVVYTMLWTNSIVFNIGSLATVVVCTIITAIRVNMSMSWRKSLTISDVGVKPKVKTISNQSKLRESSDSNRVRDISQSNGVGNENTAVGAIKQSSKMNKEKRLVKMISVISVIFFICYVPDMIFNVASFHFQSVKIRGKYHNLSMTIYCFTFLMETVNSSINVFVYYRMSSRYRADMRRLFGMVDK